MLTEAVSVCYMSMCGHYAGGNKQFKPADNIWAKIYTRVFLNTNYESSEINHKISHVRLFTWVVVQTKCSTTRVHEDCHTPNCVRLVIYRKGRTNFPKLQQLSQNFRHQKQVPYWWLTNIRRYRTKFSRHGDPEPGLSAPLAYMVYTGQLSSFVFFVLG